MKRIGENKTIIVVDVLILVLLLILYMRSYNYKIGIALIIYVVVNALLIALCYIDYLIKEEEFCYKNLSDTQLTEVIPLKVSNDTKNAIFYAMIAKGEYVNIFVRYKNELTDILYESVSFEDFRKYYKIK